MALQVNYFYPLFILVSTLFCALKTGLCFSIALDQVIATIQGTDREIASYLLQSPDVQG